MAKAKTAVAATKAAPAKAAPAKAAPAKAAPKAAPAKSQAAQRTTQVAQQTAQQNLSAWEQAKQLAAAGRGSSTTIVDEGNYLGRLSTAKRVSTGDGDKAVFELTVYDHPEADGQVGQVWSCPLDSQDPQQLQYLCRALTAFGIPSDDITDPDAQITQEVLDQLVENAPTVRFAAKRSKKDETYMNIYINGPVDDGGGEGATLAETGATGQDADTSDVSPEDVVEDVEEVEDADAVGTIDVDSTISWPQGGQTKTGTVIRFEEDGAKIVARSDETGKPVRIAADKVSLVAPD